MVPARGQAPADRAYSAFSPDPARRFDFWVGEWDVNLRMLQADGSFRDTVTAQASIYSILDGKAVLELWDSAPIKGFSLRYYDPDEEGWVLWLDWPQPNRSGLSNLTGNFRHGRGEFTRTSTDAEGNGTLQFKLARGAYRAMLEAQDRFGKKITARRPLLVAKLALMRWHAAYSRHGSEQ